MRLPQHTTDPRNPRIVFRTPAWAVRLRVDAHGPEFRQTKEPAAASLPHLRIEDRTPGVQQDRDGSKNSEHCAWNTDGHRHDDVKHAFGHRRRVVRSGARKELSEKPTVAQMADGDALQRLLVDPGE